MGVAAIARFQLNRPSIDRTRSVVNMAPYKSPDFFRWPILCLHCFNRLLSFLPINDWLCKLFVLPMKSSSVQIQSEFDASCLCLSFNSLSSILMALLCLYLYLSSNLSLSSAPSHGHHHQRFPLLHHLLGSTLPILIWHWNCSSDLAPDVV